MTGLHDHKVLDLLHMCAALSHVWLPCSPGLMTLQSIDPSTCLLLPLSERAHLLEARLLAILHLNNQARLNEDQIPDLQHIWVIHVDHGGSVAAPNAIVMNLSTRATRPLVSHLPKVVFAVEGQHTLYRQVLQPAGRESGVCLAIVVAVGKGSRARRAELAACRQRVGSDSLPDA